MTTDITAYQSYMEKKATMHRDNAIQQLERVITEATRVKSLLEAGDTPPSTVSGSFLNGQNFDDAERSIVRWFDAAGVAANLANAD